MFWKCIFAHYFNVIVKFVILLISIKLVWFNSLLSKLRNHAHSTTINKEWSPLNDSEKMYLHRSGNACLIWHWQAWQQPHVSLASTPIGQLCLLNVYSSNVSRHLKKEKIPKNRMCVTHASAIYTMSSLRSPSTDWSTCPEHENH